MAHSPPGARSACRAAARGCSMGRRESESVSWSFFLRLRVRRKAPTLSWIRQSSSSPSTRLHVHPKSCASQKYKERKRGLIPEPLSQHWSLVRTGPAYLAAEGLLRAPTSPRSAPPRPSLSPPPPQSRTRLCLPPDPHPRALAARASSSPMREREYEQRKHTSQPNREESAPQMEREASVAVLRKPALPTTPSPSP